MMYYGCSRRGCRYYVQSQGNSVTESEALTRRHAAIGVASARQARLHPFALLLPVAALAELSAASDILVEAVQARQFLVPQLVRQLPLHALDFGSTVLPIRDGVLDPLKVCSDGLHTSGLQVLLDLDPGLQLRRRGVELHELHLLPLGDRQRLLALEAYTAQDRVDLSSGILPLQQRSSTIALLCAARAQGRRELPGAFGAAARRLAALRAQPTLRRLAHPARRRHVCEVPRVPDLHRGPAPAACGAVAAPAVGPVPCISTASAALRLWRHLRV
mmetsp:Transcript_104513/g.263027  ORF Transcript_104513/g.263027 Transcript_104513/m.263027 type:complete len:274 (+) Transcript_104513:1-822(+)